MTVVELNYDFDVKIDRVASLSREDFNLAEKDWLFNEAQDVILKTKYSGTNVRRAAFEQDQKRIDDLATLHIKYPLQPGISLIEHDGVYELDLSQLEYNYLFLTRARVVINDPTCPTTKYAIVKETQSDDLNYALNDPFNNSDTTEILANFGKSSNVINNSASIYLYPGSQSLGDIFVEYIKYPARINYGGYEYIDGITYPTQECELPEHVHRELVDTAVAIASGIIENGAYAQAKQQKLFVNE